MSNNQNELTKNIRIPTETHEAIKQKCKDEGRLMGAYVDGVLKNAITGNNTEMALAGAEGENPPTGQLEGDHHQASHQ
jgi:hypothetical protein